MKRALSMLCALLLAVLPLCGHAECAHEWRDDIVLEEGTCVTLGVMQTICTKCSATGTRPYYGTHCYTIWQDIELATCQQQGLRRYTCRNCGYTKVCATNALAHNFGQYTTLAPATAYTPGLRGHTCLDCGAYEEESYCMAGTLYRGVDARAAVQDMQKKLKKLGLYKGSTDGTFGPLTEKAVIALQKKYALPDTGIADAQTLDQLALAWSEAEHCSAPAPTATYPEHCVLETLADGSQQLHLCRAHTQLTMQAWYLEDEEAYALWLQEWDRLYDQCGEQADESERDNITQAHDWALLLIKSQRVVWKAKYNNQSDVVNPMMAQLIVDKCIELCRQMGQQ